jgi:hypothetical protein
VLPLTFGRTDVSLNYLLHRLQVSPTNESGAKTLEAHHSYASLARAYASRIDDFVPPDRTTAMTVVLLR